jgi:hypothetical protein
MFVKVRKRHLHDYDFAFVASGHRALSNNSGDSYGTNLNTVSCVVP